MAYTTADGRRQLLDRLAAGTEEIGTALALLSEAYEHLDERTAERLEEELFQPTQSAYGGAKRTYAAFAAHHQLPGHVFQSPAPPAPSNDTKRLIEAAVEAAGRADGTLAELQDSMLPVEVGDPELRAGIARVRELIGGLRGRAREIVRTLGR